MYTQARQFPHFTGMTDDQIRAVARRAMAGNPKYRRLMRVRSLVMLLGMAVTVFGLVSLGGWQLGSAMVFAGVAATVLVLVWNLVWVNTVLFRQTEREIKQKSA